MEFQLKTPIENTLQPIDFNFEQLRAYLDERLQVYRGLIVSPAGVRAAKADRAKLNKFREALKAQRLEVKRSYMKPFDAFDAKMDELIGMVDKPVTAIAQQIKHYEDEAKAQKREDILAFFNEHIGELDGILTFERLFNARWLNASYKMKEIESEILGTIKKLRNDIRIIQVMQLPFEQEVLSVLIDTLDIGAALARKNALETGGCYRAMTLLTDEKPSQREFESLREPCA